VLGMEPPEDIKLVTPPKPDSFESYVRTQERRSRGHEVETVKPRVRRALKWFKDNIKTEFTGDVLDLGSRDGFALSYMKKLGMTSQQGIDLSQRAVDYAQSVGRDVSYGDMMNLGYADSQFDFVTTQHSLEHVPEPHKAVSEMFRVLKPGGYALIVVPKEGATPDNAHYCIFPSIDALRSLVAKYGDADESTVVTAVLPMSKGLRELLYCVRKRR